MLDSHIAARAGSPTHLLFQLLPLITGLNDLLQLVNLFVDFVQIVLVRFIILV